MQLFSVQRYRWSVRHMLLPCFWPSHRRRALTRSSLTILTACSLVSKPHTYFFFKYSKHFSDILYQLQCILKLFTLSSQHLHNNFVSLLMQEKLTPIFLAFVTTVIGRKTKMWGLLKRIPVQMFSYTCQLGSCGFDYFFLIRNVPFSTSLTPHSRETHY